MKEFSRHWLTSRRGVNIEGEGSIAQREYIKRDAQEKLGRRPWQRKGTI
jgi:hypothetical protein